ncbi:MAG TPA: hypothetical protein V6D35_19985 [Candidatus Sericytochromatia bacterium]
MFNSAECEVLSQEAVTDIYPNFSTLSYFQPITSKGHSALSVRLNFDRLSCRAHAEVTQHSELLCVFLYPSLPLAIALLTI